MQAKSNKDEQQLKASSARPSKVREEGELTSSDDDALLTSTAAPHPPSSVPNAPSIMRTSSQGFNSGKLSSGGSTQPQTPYRKGFSKNQVLLNSSNPGWCARSANENLVISFSDDDDSGSDAEERRREKASTCDRPPPVLNSNRRPPALPHVTMKTVRTAKNEGKLMPQKVSSSRAFNSSITKAPESSVRSGVSALAEQKSWLKKSNITGRRSASQDPGCSKSLVTSSSKLEDLRQQIAARESELKLKLVQQNKENISDTCREANAKGRKVLSRKCKSVPIDVQNHPKEPDRKRLKTDAPSATVSCSLSDWISLPKKTASLINTTPTDPLERSHPGEIGINQPSRSAPNQDIDESNKANDHCDATSALKKVKSTTNSSLQAHSLQLSNSKFEAVNVSPGDSNLSLRLGRSQGFRSGDVDLQSLFELEELHDKELEEAQENRRKCEVEERNALNAYRRAQRALLEANARCTYFFRKRELYSAQLRSCLMEDSSILCSSSQHNVTEEKWNLANNNSSDVNLDLIPLSDQIDEFEAGNRLGYDSNVQSVDDDAHNRSSANEDGQNLGSEACSEPDACTSELVRGNNFADNGIQSPSGDPNLSPDDDSEAFHLDHRSLHTNVTFPRFKDNTKESEKDIDIDSATIFPSNDVSKDPLFLEEYLRSKLISRLGVTSLKRNGTGDTIKSSVDRVTEEDVVGGKNQMIMHSVSLSDPDDSVADCRDGPKEPNGSISKPLLINQNQQVEEHSLNNSPAPSFNPEECNFLSVGTLSTSIVSSSSIFRSAMKAASSVILGSMESNGHRYGTPDTWNIYNSPFTLNHDKLCLEMTSSAEQLVKCVGFGKIDSYTCKSAIDPFWPLCMFELRGRCNNDECPWQHAKDYSGNDDCQSGLASNCQKLVGHTEFSCASIPPRYLVCLDSLKDDSYRSHKARDCWPSGKHNFSRSLAVSSSLMKHFPSSEPCLHGNDGCVESYGGGGHSLYFQSRTGTGNPLQKGLTDNDQSLEMALFVLAQELNKTENMKKALFVLSRALEADPSSSPVWIIYLLLYYSIKLPGGLLSKKSSVADDFFSHAVKHIEVSYELWLLYINSRGRLDERLSAYERALSRLCHYASTNHEQWMHSSASILDLFVQMLYCFCISGNSGKALWRIKSLVHADGDSDESHSLLLSDILQCLTISDKCIFWVCCVYLVIYRKLPDSLVQQFEFEKDVSLMEWPSVHISVEEKQYVSRLMEMAIDSVGLNVNRESIGGTHKSAHLLAINHIKLMVAIYGVESCRVYLEKYRNYYSSCIEYVLFSARACDFTAEIESFEKFEEALSSWPKNVSGNQCIWNQFAEYAFEKGRPDKAKQIMDQWFHSAGVPLQIDGEKGDDSKSMSADPHSESSLSNLLSSYSNVDHVYGLLNLSLYKLFQNDVLEAHMAVDRALKVANAEVLRLCIKEHASFLFNNGSSLLKDMSLHGLIDILKGYMIHARAIPVLEPLTRQFIQDVQKPRTRQLVRNMLSPISPDSFMVNSVLEIWFGSSLLPPTFGQLKDMVDFVEAILEISPANYQLVISVCKLVCRDYESSNSKSSSVLFWASSLLVNTIYHAIPSPPEHVWVEAADLLSKLTSVQEISENFHQRALIVFPFSIKLWKSYLNQSTGASKRSSVVEAAREKGLELA